MDEISTFPTYGELTQTKGWSGGGPPPVGTSLEADLGTTNTRYTEGNVLGAGGMGKVVLARDARIGRDVALKILHPQHELDPAERARFLREAQVQGQLEHPSIVPVYDIDRRDDGTTFFTMRRVLGRTLAAIIDDLKKGNAEAIQKYTQRVLLQAFATVCLTIDYAHKRNVIHRDLKPANIMLGEYGEVYVLDWGLARMIDPDAPVGDVPRLSVPGAMMGTPLYMPPEQMADPDVDKTADVFSLGMILFEILTLQRCRDPRALYAPVEARPSVRVPHMNIAPELEAICVQATQSLVVDRFQSAREIEEAIARYLEGDRDREQRRSIAARHAERAREALATTGDEAEQEALRHLMRAIALEPTNREHVAQLAEIIGTPPRTKPPEIVKEIEDASQDLIRAGGRYGLIAMSSWFLFFPFVLWLGIRRVDYMIAIAIPIALTVIAGFWVSRRKRNGYVSQCAAMSMLVIGGMTLSRLFGPLILVPTLFATWAIVSQAYPYAFLRRFALITSSLVVAVPLVLELAGVLPPSYSFQNGRFEILPQMTDLPHTPVMVFLGVASIATALLPALFVERMRVDLSRSQERELMQNWKLRRMRDDLLRANTQPT
jgi:eukaryotic-like serine/threonine-protein kinase